MKKPCNVCKKEVGPHNTKAIGHMDNKKQGYRLFLYNCSCGATLVLDKKPLKLNGVENEIRNCAS